MGRSPDGPIWPRRGLARSNPTSNIRHPDIGQQTTDSRQRTPHRVPRSLIRKLVILRCMLRYRTAGESHGQALIALVEGLPANLSIDFDFIDNELRRRQKGNGRGGRMKIERDQVRFLSGVRHGKTIGSPVAMMIENRDWPNWEEIMSIRKVSDEATEKRRVTRPRPGHTDLVGSLKYNQIDARNILERSSARETAARVAAGALCKILLRSFGVEILSHTTAIGNARVPDDFEVTWEQLEAVRDDD